MNRYLKFIIEFLGWPEPEKGTLIYWQERILFIGYLIGMLVCGLAVVFVSTGYQIEQGQFVTIAIEICGFVWTLAVLLSRGRISYFYRSAVAIAVVYVAAVITLYEVGPTSVASAEFVVVCIFSALFFGVKGSVYSLMIIGLTLGCFGGLLSLDWLPWGTDQISLSRFPGWFLWLLLWSFLSSLGPAILLTGLDRSIKKERELTNSLEETVAKRTQDLNETNQQLIKENTNRKQAEKEKEEKIEQLQQAIKEINTLQGLLPICTTCKKIRDDKGYWSQIESYIQAHSEAKFSHSICPDCTEKLYGDEEWYMDMKKKKEGN